jgi:DNA-binding beta-propeller fold protein YncE
MKAILTIAVLCILSACSGAETLTLKRTVPLPGVKGRFDHFAIDAKGHRLFVAALGNNTLEVVDIAAGKHLKSVTGLHKPTGVLYLAEPNQVAVANGDDGTLKFFDAGSYALVESIGSLDDADNVRFDPKTKLIYAGYADGALAVIDSTTMKQTGSIKLAAHPESFQLASAARRLRHHHGQARSLISPFPATLTTCFTTLGVNASTSPAGQVSWMSSLSATPTPICCGRGLRRAPARGLHSFQSG